MWTRRTFLRALGAAGATASAGPLLSCAASGANKGARSAPKLSSSQLARALGILGAAKGEVSLYSEECEYYELSLDHEEERFRRGRDHRVVLRAEEHGERRVSVLQNPDNDALLLAATSMVDSAVERPLKLPRAVNISLEPGAKERQAEYRDTVRALFAEAKRHGGSRVIYRSAQLSSTRTESRYLSRSANLRARSQRTRAEVSMGAWASEVLAGGYAQASGLGGPSAATLGPQLIAKAAEDCLAHLHARSYPEGSQAVLLAPDVAAHVAYWAIASSSAYQPSGSAVGALRIVDTPSKGYGARAFDMHGNRRSERTVVGEGATSLGAGDWTPSHVEVEVGVEPREAMIARIERGVLLEGPLHCALSRDQSRFALVCSRAREIREGRFTGRLFAQTLATAHVSEFLADTVSLGEEHVAVAFDEDGQYGSAAAPLWLSRAWLGAA